MKKFIGYFKEFHRDYFNPVMYLVILAFLGILIFFNYKYNFENGTIDRRYLNTPMRPLLYFLTHAVAYHGTLFIVYLFRRKDGIFTKAFWFKSTLVFVILALDRSWFFYPELVKLVPRQTAIFYYACLTNLSSALTIALPFLMVKYLLDRDEDFGLYGLRFKDVNFKPYWTLLGLMIPLLFVASFLPDIQNYYPTYKKVFGHRFAEYYQISEQWAKVIYETCYLTDFVFTELFFRGVLVLGFAKLLGKNAIFPMAATYCVLHFGKPMGECISSIFGGYILGVIALYSRNIWGGVFVHGGIALFMDLFAFWQMNGG